MAAALEVTEFDLKSVATLLGNSTPSRYIQDYLQTIKANTVAIEHRYVDRHYLEDFQCFYSRSFEVPPASCERLHFFSLPSAKVTSHFATSFQSNEDQSVAEEELTKHYLGFVVVRPLPGARVGRTVLKTYPPDGHRRYEVVRPYRTHLAGLRLTIDGLAYQEQDQGVAVCASTAIWSALQRVAHVAGHRTPTPAAVTAAARSPLPASFGLNDDQMATALANLGYLADQFEPADNRLLFRAKIVSYLRSQLPVVLLLRREIETGAGHVTVGHAVTVTGFREPPTIVDVPTTSPAVAPIRMSSGSLDVVYVHDDNLGSHAHYELYDGTEQDDEGHELLHLWRGRRNGLNPTYWKPDEWTVSSALVPKTDKMRLPIEELFLDLVEFRRVFEEIVLKGELLHYDVNLVSGVLFKRHLVAKGLNPSQLAVFVQALALPRHVGRIQVHGEHGPLCDVLLDVSEINRDQPRALAIVALGIPENTQAALDLTAVGAVLKCPVITRPSA